MNPNVQMVNENLWVVNFEHVRLKWIEGLDFLNGSDDRIKYAALTQDGKLVVNKATEHCNNIKLMMNRLMQRSDGELADMLINLQRMVKLPHQDKYEEFLLCMVQWEIKRRSVQNEYIKKHRLLFVIKNIKERWCKKLWQPFKQQ